MARRAKTDDFYFEGFESPNTTPVPDVVFDRLLARLGEAELKALLYIIRRTFGFKRDRDPISFNQFLHGITTRDGRVLDEGCGVRNRTTLSNALKTLEEKGIVLSEKGTDERGENVTTVYRLRFRPGEASPTAEPGGVVRNSYHRSTNSPPPVVRNSYPQETGLQETAEQDSKLRTVQPIVDKSQSSRIRPRGAEPARMSEVMETLPLGAAISRWRQQQHRHPGDQAELNSAGSPAGPRRPAGRPGTVRRRDQPRRRVYDEDRQVLLAFMDDFAREFQDRAPLSASVSRAYNLLHRSGLSREVFLDQLYQARAITKERSASIRSQAGKDGMGLPVKAKMAFFFAVLEDLLGLKPVPDDPAEGPVWPG